MFSATETHAISRAIGDACESIVRDMPDKAQAASIVARLSAVEMLVSEAFAQCRQIESALVNLDKARRLYEPRITKP